jgi:hypothetical protein
MCIWIFAKIWCILFEFLTWKNCWPHIMFHKKQEVAKPFSTGQWWMGGFIMCEYNEGFPIFTYSVKGSCNLTTHLSIFQVTRKDWTIFSQDTEKQSSNWQLGCNSWRLLERSHKSTMHVESQSHGCRHSSTDTEVHNSNASHRRFFYFRGPFKKIIFVLSLQLQGCHSILRTP